MAVVVSTEISGILPLKKNSEAANKKKSAINLYKCFKITPFPVLPKWYKVKLFF